MNTSRLSLAAKIVAATLLSFQTQSLYAAPVTAEESCGDGCIRHIVKDVEAKTIRVVTSSTNDNEHNSDVYSYGNNQFEHVEINNSANFNKTPFMLFHNVDAKSLKVENSGKLSGQSNEFSGNPDVGHISERFELKNSGVIELDGGAYSAIFVNGSDTAEFYVENTGEMNFRTQGFDFNNAKTVRFVNKGTINSSLPSYVFNVSNVENAIIENDGGTIKGDFYRAINGFDNPQGNLHIKSKGGKLSGIVGLYGSNNTIELENTDITEFSEISIHYPDSEIINENSKLDKNNTLILNQEGRIKTGSEFGAINLSGIDTLTVGKNGKAIVVDNIQLFEPYDGVTLNAGKLTNNGVIALDPKSRNVDIRYELTENNGVIDLNDGSNEPAQTLTLHGNYVGSEGSVLRVDHRWNEANEEENDLLIIKGKASGKTRVEIRDTTVGDSIRNDVLSRGGWSKPLVIVEQGTDGKAVFEGVVDTQSAEQAYLTQRVDENGNVVFAWVLKYADSISGYAQAGVVNQDMGLEQLGRLHQRVGEQANGDPRLNSWGRTRVTEGVVQGKKSLGVDSRRGLVQVGQDLAIKEYAAGYAHQGFMFSYSWADNQFFYRDPLKNTVDASGKLVGKGKSVMYSLGAYHTYYGKDSTYLDIVANLSWLENKYLGQKSLSQKGYSAALGAEIGRSYPLNHQWKIEPQAQLKMQYLVLDGMNDGKRKVEGSSHFTAQGRLGVRVTDGMLYASVNLVQELTPAKVISKIGQSKVEEHYNATLFDVSLGANMPLNKAKTLTLYGDLNYSRALDGSNRIFSHRNGRENYSAQVGIRFQW